MAAVTPFRYALDLLVEPIDLSSLYIGVVAPMTGGLGVSVPSILFAAELAASDENDAGSKGGAPIQLVLIDAEQAASSSILHNLSTHFALDAVVAVHTSELLEMISERVPAQVPYVFVPDHEGIHSIEYFYCASKATSEPRRSALEWLIERRDARRWAIIGTDYRWPREMSLLQSAVIEANAARVVHNEIVPSVGRSHPNLAAADRIIASGADGVILNMVGRNLIAAIRSVRARGQAHSLVQFAPGGLDENILLAIDGDRTGNLYAAGHSFHSNFSERRAALYHRSRVLTPSSPVMTTWAEHTYDAIRVVAQYAREGNLPRLAQELDSARTQIGMRAVEMDARDHLAVASGFNFSLVED